MLSATEKKGPKEWTLQRTIRPPVDLGFNDEVRDAAWWRGGAVGRASDLRFTGRGFESCLGTIVQWPWGSYLHLCASVTKQYNLVPIEGR